MNTLGGIELPRGIQKMDPYSQSGVRATVEITKNGVPVKWAGSLRMKTILLAGTENQGIIEDSELAALYVLSTSPDATYVLVFDGISTMICFQHESPPVISASVLRPGSKYYNNLQIKLMEV